MAGKRKPWSTAPVPTAADKRALRDVACHEARRTTIDVDQAVNYLESGKPGHALDNLETAAEHMAEFVKIIKAYVGPARERPPGRRRKGDRKRR